MIVVLAAGYLYEKRFKRLIRTPESVKVLLKTEHLSRLGFPLSLAAKLMQVRNGKKSDASPTESVCAHDDVIDPTRTEHIRSNVTRDGWLRRRGRVTPSTLHVIASRSDVNMRRNTNRKLMTTFFVGLLPRELFQLSPRSQASSFVLTESSVSNCHAAVQAAGGGGKSSSRIDAKGARETLRNEFQAARRVELMKVSAVK
jgi:hypothetical protein